MTFICPFCGKELIFIGKRIGADCFGDLGAKFYACGCGNNIVSEEFKNKDGTPKIFYANKWSHRTNGLWFFLDENYGNVCWGTPKDVPKNLRTIRIKVAFT
jgi:hypothetical protein